LAVRAPGQPLAQVVPPVGITEGDAGLVQEGEPRGPADDQVEALAGGEQGAQHRGGIRGAGGPGDPYDPRRTPRLSWLDWVHRTEPIRSHRAGTGGGAPGVLLGERADGGGCTMSGTRPRWSQGERARTAGM